MTDELQISPQQRIVDLESEVRDLKAQLVAMDAKLMDASPEVTRLRLQLEQLKRDLAVDLSQSALAIPVRTHRDAAIQLMQVDTWNVQHGPFGEVHLHVELSGREVPAEVRIVAELRGPNPLPSVVQPIQPYTPRMVELVAGEDFEPGDMVEIDMSTGLAMPVLVEAHHFDAGWLGLSSLISPDALHEAQRNATLAAAHLERESARATEALVRIYGCQEHRANRVEGCALCSLAATLDGGP